jgi:cellulose synthase/poly-beta-1,6-N-acetylglucosamine synthase-like glycosyltransferase
MAKFAEQAEADAAKHIEPEKPVLAKKHPTISVLVPVRDEQDDLRECLNSLMTLDYPSIEIIVVGDGTVDKTREIISRYPVRLFAAKGVGAYAARNIGIGVAKNEILAFTDSDCVVDRAWLKNLAACYTDDRVGGAGGRVLALKSTRLVEAFQSLGPQEIFDSSKRVELGAMNTNRFLVSGLGSGNMSFRLSVLKEVNGFSEDMSKCGDYEICGRIQKAGYKLVYEPKAQVRHKPKSSVTQMITQFYQYGKSQPQLLKKVQDVHSYFELKTYLFPTRSLRLKLPIQMLITIDFFNLATLSLILVLLSPKFLLLSGALALMCLKQAWTKTREVSTPAMRVKLLLVFPFLHALRSYAFSFGRFLGGLANGLLSI